MLKFNELIFDEHVQVAGGTADHLTGQHWNELLGRYDLLAFHILAGGITSTGDAPTLTLSVETSCDGVHWVPKGLATSFPLSLERPANVWMEDDGRRPSYALVRLRAQLTCADKSGAEVRIYATGRDTAGVPHRVYAPKSDAYFWQRPGGKHKLTEEQKAALLELCKKRHLPLEVCEQFTSKFDP